MSGVLLVVALIVLAAWVVFAVDAGLGSRTLARLADLPPCPAADCPSVSIVVAGKDEERAIEAAVRTLLAQDLPHFEVVAVNDRSTDRTGAILDAVAAEDPRLTVVHVADLPPRWLGKNHALHVGAARATGQLVLFTDADVHFAEDAVRRAITYQREHDLDHLTILPDLTMKSPALQLFAGTFAIMFAGFTRPWKARDQKSRACIGIGAFNLVRADAYHARGGHAAIAMRPDDDLRLGRLMKSGGGRQDVLIGKGLLDVEWYTSVGGVVRGLEKNAFAGLDYRLWLQVLATPLQLVCGVWPFVAVFVTEGPARWLSAATIAVVVVVFAGTRRTITTGLWYGLLFPVGTLFMVYVQWRAVILTLVRGGIRWRGTFHSLEELRA